MTDDELRNLMMGSCYIKQTIPGPVHLSGVSGIEAGNADFVRAGKDLVKRGYFRQLQPPPEVAEDLDSVLGTFELTPLGLEDFESFLKKQGQHTPFGKVDAATIVIQFPWFGGKSTYIDNSSTENTTIDISLKVALGNIIEQIEKSGATPEEKADAKSRLKAFLKHPLVIAIAGAAVKPLLESL